MIFGKCANAACYQGLHPRLDTALGLLNDDFLQQVQGTVQIAGESLYLSRFDYQTLPHEQTVFESHERYLDIHLVRSGIERIDLASPHKLTQRSHEGDCRLFDGQAEQTIILRPGDFLLTFAEDAHRVKMMAGDAPEAVHKIVFKVLVSD